MKSKLLPFPAPYAVDEPGDGNLLIVSIANPNRDDDVLQIIIDGDEERYEYALGVARLLVVASNARKELVEPLALFARRKSADGVPSVKASELTVAVETILVDHSS